MIDRALYRYRELLKKLVLKDLKLKYRGSVFGFLWSLANPLLMIVVYTVAFTYILRIREREVRLLPDARAARRGRSSPAPPRCRPAPSSTMRGLLKSVLFPRAILPIGTVLFNLAQYLLTLSVFLPAYDVLVPACRSPRRCCCFPSCSRCRSCSRSASR